MKIDVIMCTYNSRKRGLLHLVLRSIRDYIPLNRLIVVDKYSNDGTVEFIKQYFRDKSIIVRSNSSIAHARYIGLRFVETEWFAFIDDDAIILPNWWSTLSRYITLRRVGAVEGSYISLPDVSGELHDIFEKEAFMETRLTRRLSINELTRRDVIIHGLNPVRSVLSNVVVIRKETVVDWRPPNKAGAYEDYLITQHVINKGFSWIIVNKPVALHGAPPRDALSKLKSSIRKGLWEGAGIKYTGISKDFIILYSLSRLGGAVIRLVKDKDVFDLAMRLAFLLSLLSSDKYLSPSR